MEYAIVEKNNHLAVHSYHYSYESAEKHLRETVPSYCARGFYMDKTLTPESFEIIPRA